MAHTYVPTREEIALIRRLAEKSAGCSPVKIEPGIRCSLSGREGKNMNIALISDDPDFNDTDLFDKRDWKAFTKGFELTADGRGIVDFYVYNRNRGAVDEGSLETNVTCWFDRDGLVRVTATGNGEMWVRAKTCCKAEA